MRQKQTLQRKIKTSSLKTLRNKAWKVFSIYIRCRDHGICFTCGKQDDWHNTHSGHFMHGLKYPRLYFDERNVHAQCVACNKFRSGNLAVYAVKLVELYGPSILVELQDLKLILKVPREFYEQIVEKY